MVHDVGGEIVGDHHDDVVVGEAAQHRRPKTPKLSEIADLEQVHTTLAAVLTAGCTDLAECS